MNVPRRNEEENRGKIVEHAFWMQKEGYAESTISRRTRLLGTLANKGANLEDTESVKETIAKTTKMDHQNQRNRCRNIRLPTKNARHNLGQTKLQIRQKTTHHLDRRRNQQSNRRMQQKDFSIPSAAQRNGMRCGEAFMLKWTDFNFENRSVDVKPEKGSEPRQLKTSTILIAMLDSLPRDKEQPFGCSHIHFSRAFRKQRTKVANNLKNDRIRKIHFHTLRHWKATTEYAKTKDILHVMKFSATKPSKTRYSTLNS